MGRTSVGPQYIYGSITTADKAEMEVDDDLTVTVDIALPDWTPTAEVVIAQQWDADADERGWQVAVSTTGAIVFRWSDDGETGGVDSETSSATLAALDPDQRQVVQVTVDLSAGDVDFASGDTVADLAALGTTQSAGAPISVFDSSDVVRVGATGCQLFGATIEIGSDTVASPTAADVKRYQSTYRDAEGNIWNGAGGAIQFSRVYPTSAVGVNAPAAAPVQPLAGFIDPEVKTRMDQLSYVPVTGPTAPDVNA